jgi:hypothetical protein
MPLPVPASLLGRNFRTDQLFNKEALLNDFRIRIRTRTRIRTVTF